MNGYEDIDVRIREERDIAHGLEDVVVLGWVEMKSNLNRKCRTRIIGSPQAES